MNSAPPLTGPPWSPLRRVLAGDRDREQLLAGLDDVDTAILTAVLERFPNHLGQDP